MHLPNSATPFPNRKRVLRQQPLDDSPYFLGSPTTRQMRLVPHRVNTATRGNWRNSHLVPARSLHTGAQGNFSAREALQDLRQRGVMDRIVAGQARLLDRWNESVQHENGVATHFSPDWHDSSAQYGSEFHHYHQGNHAEQSFNCAAESNFHHRPHRRQHPRRHRSTASVHDRVNPRSKVELYPGQKVKILDRSYVEDAIENGTASVYRCAGCRKKLLAGNSVKLIYCPQCGTITPANLSKLLRSNTDRNV